MMRDSAETEHEHYFEFDGDPRVPLTWEEIETRCHGLWQIPSDNDSDNETEDLRQTYADIRKRVIELDEPSTEADGEFSWLKAFRKSDVLQKNFHGTVKYAVPMHVTGDPQKANLFHCLLNPGVVDGIDKDASIKEVMNNDDLPIYEASNPLTYKIYHKEDNVFSFYWKNFDAPNTDTECRANDDLRYRVLFTFYYYLTQYYSTIVLHYDGDVPDSLKYFSCYNRKDKIYVQYPGDFLDEYTELCKEDPQKARELKQFDNPVEYIGAQNIERLIRAPICNIELVPFRSDKRNQIRHIVNKSPSAHLTVAILVRRLLDFIEGRSPAPIIVIARAQTQLILGPNNLFDHFLSSADIHVRGEKIDTAASLLRALEQCNGGENIIFLSSSDYKASLSCNNLVHVMRQWNATKGIETVVAKVDANNEKVKPSVNTHKKLFGESLRVDLPEDK